MDLDFSHRVHRGLRAERRALCLCKQFRYSSSSTWRYDRNGKMKAVIRVVCAGILLAVVGTGIGFLQGYAAFKAQAMEVRLNFSGWSAWAGCVIALPVGLLAYLVGGEKTQSVQWWSKLVSITAAVGIASAWLLGSAFDGGWISLIVTPTMALLLASVLGVEAKQSG